MKTTGNTVLIIGGSAGIGFEMAKELSKKFNNVIITGRNEDRLSNALAKLKNVSGIISDISSREDTDRMVKKINADFKDLNMIINNAGRALIHNVATDTDGYKFAEEEMLTNYLSIIRLNQLLLPVLEKQKEAAIVNVSSVVAIVPGSLSTYSASKAALHSYTQSLRILLTKENSSVKVFEVMPPLVNTELSAAIGGENGIPPLQVATEFLEGLAKDELEIHVGQTQYIYDLYLQSPQAALEAMNGARS